MASPSAAVNSSSRPLTRWSLRARRQSALACSLTWHAATRFLATRRTRALLPGLGKPMAATATRAEHRRIVTHCCSSLLGNSAHRHAECERGLLQTQPKQNSLSQPQFAQRGKGGWPRTAHVPARLNMAAESLHVVGCADHGARQRPYSRERASRVAGSVRRIWPVAAAVPMAERRSLSRVTDCSAPSPSA